MKKIYALLDCNNFYVSCERIFNPKLKNKPVVVMSNNDGCIIARSQEAKKIGIPMGAPIHKWEKVLKQNKVEMFSPNFSLYGDISNRVMETIAEYSPEIEVYSIDEAFLIFESKSKINLENQCKKIKDIILKNIGIPVSIGIAETKTLAKLANRIAKNYPEYNGVFNFLSLSEEERIEFFKILAVGDVWGIGWSLEKFLNSHGITSIYDFIQLDESWIKQKTSVNGVRTLLELKGTPCITNHFRKTSYSIISSRSFGKSVESKKDLNESIAAYITIASEKLRSQKAVCNYVKIYITTNLFNKTLRQYRASLGSTLDFPTNNTSILIKKASELLDKIYKPGYLYKKSMVILYEITPDDVIQPSILNPEHNFKKDRNLMSTIDKINKSFGRDTIKYASVGFDQTWKMKQEKRSKRFTTNWNDLLEIKI